MSSEASGGTEGAGGPALVRAILECRWCDATDEYAVAPDDWHGGEPDIECAGCGRSGPFRVAGDGRVKFDDVSPADVEVSAFEDVTYETQVDEYEPPEGHENVGGAWLAPEANLDELNGGIELIGAVHIDAAKRADLEEKLPTWDDVKQLFNADENGTTTRAYNLAAEIINHRYTIATIRTTGHVYFYDSDQGYYVLKGKTYLNEIINENLKEAANENRRREIRQKVIEENYVSRNEFKPPEGKVCVENGVLDLEKLELEPWSPDYHFTARIKAKWPEDGEPDPWAEAWWLRGLKDGHDNPEEREKILRWIGYALESWHHDLEANLFFVGYRRSGKSTIQEAIQELFGGPPTVVNLSPQQIADTRFDAGRLRDAQLNTVNDINATKIKNSGKIKRIFSGESIKIEDKHKDAEFDAPNSKHLFTANWLPRITGSDEAVFRRIMLTEFVKKVAKEDRDPEYKSRLKRPDVRQAILVTAAKARLRLREDGGKFPADRGANDTRKVWDSWRDAHKRFLYLQFDITGDPDDQVEREAYWQAAHEFAAKNGWEPSSPRSITKALSYTPGVYAQGDGDFYGGLRWREIDAAELETPTFRAASRADPKSSNEPSPSTFDVDDSEQASIVLTQGQKVERVRAAVAQVADGAGAAELEAVVDVAEEKGVEPDDAQHIISEMLSDGRLYNPESDKIQFT